MIIWKQHKDIIAATSLRNTHKPSNNNLALHCGDNLENVLQNREALAHNIHIPTNTWVFAQQTHSANIQKVSHADAGKGIYSYESGIPFCDALYTREENLLLGVFHADCVPILLHDPIENIICAIHSGWMGTIQQITTHALQVLIDIEGCKPSQIEAYIGPAIAFSSFEVGMEVVEQVQKLPFDTSSYICLKDNGKALVDNKGLNYQMLLHAGLLDEHIMIDKNDTFQENDAFFSYRRDKHCGRHLSFIVRPSQKTS